MSLGGLLVKKVRLRMQSSNAASKVIQAILLALRNPHSRSIALSTAGMVFLGVPHSETAFINADYRYQSPEGHYQAIRGDHPCCLTEFESIIGTMGISEEFRRVASLYRIVYSMPGSLGSCIWVEVVDEYFQMPDPTREASMELMELRQSALRIISQTVTDIIREDRETNDNLPIVGRCPEEIAQRIPGTCEWLLEAKEFKSWLTDDSPILWITGKPGAGKSFLLSFLVEHLRKPQHHRTATAFYFYDGRNESKSSASQVLWALACNIMVQRSQQYSNSRFFRRVASMDASMVTFPKAQYIFGVILDSFGNDERLFLIIDGLDECGPSQSLLLAETIKSACGQRPSQRIKCLISSRRSRSIGLCLDGGHKLDLSKEIRVRGDIAVFIRSKVSELLQKAPQYELHQKRLNEVLRRGAGGVFLWVSLVTDQLLLDAPSDNEAIRARIDHLPMGLEETYRRILQNIRQSDLWKAKKLLSWLLFAQRPLHLAELERALAVYADGESPEFTANQVLLDPENIRRACGGLVVVSGNGLVHFVHLSVKEFLQSVNARPIWMRNADFWANEMIAKTCLRYLMSEDVDQDPKFTSLSRRGCIPLYREDSTFLGYALQFWATHYRLAEVRSGILPALLQHFLQWSQKKWRASDQKHFKWIGDRTPIISMETPLHICSQLGFADLGKMYIQMGADIDCVSQSSGETPLHIAAANGNLEVAKLLLDRGADVGTITHSYGETALHLAVAHGHFEMVGLLLERGSDINAVTSISKLLPWQLASACGHVEIMRFLVELQGQKVTPYSLPGIWTQLVTTRLGGYLPEERMATVDAYGGSPFYMTAPDGPHWLATTLLEMVPNPAPSQAPEIVTQEHCSADSWTIVLPLRPGHDDYAIATYDEYTTNL
ncbi:hypothetical protein FGG08_004267 [Glutinoglossum americanum]|uniref:NACHT domain-containing protein n=1 Tax=Glutinoglossum americanum TaxID=1670608 RepID=A0A9P8IBS0_9PEZI|nr:hypothetical protein FGG08_004267 [Glutinoglossum americanum]